MTPKNILLAASNLTVSRVSVCKHDFCKKASWLQCHLGCYLVPWSHCVECKIFHIFSLWFLQTDNEGACINLIAYQLDTSFVLPILWKFEFNSGNGLWPISLSHRFI